MPAPGNPLSMVPADRPVRQRLRARAPWPGGTAWTDHDPRPPAPAETEMFSVLASGGPGPRQRAAGSSGRASRGARHPGPTTPESVEEGSKDQASWAMRAGLTDSHVPGAALSCVVGACPSRALWTRRSHRRLSLLARRPGRWLPEAHFGRIPRLSGPAAPSSSAARAKSG